MSSISLSQFAYQTRGCVSDGESRLYGDLESWMADALTCLLEGVCESEVESRVGVGFYDRDKSRLDYRNGYRKRTLQTNYKTLRIRVPRLRGQGYVPWFLRRGHRALAEVENWVMKSLLVGMHRCEIIRFMEETNGCRPSDRLIARVQSKLDEQAKAFKERPLTGRYEYVYLDAAWVKNISGINAKRVCILTAVGITETGEKEILGFERVQRESTSSWRGFLLRLVGRGLDPNLLRLVISDEHKGLAAAVAEVFGDIGHQLCWAHRMRNIFKAIAKSERSAMMDGLRAIYDAAHKVAAKRAFKEWSRAWVQKYPLLVASVEEDLGQLLLFYDSPELRWKYLRTSNPVERVFLELRRRNYGCGAFATTQQSDRVVYGVFQWLNKKWRGQDIWYKRQQQMAKERALKLAA